MFKLLLAWVQTLPNKNKRSVHSFWGGGVQGFHCSMVTCYLKEPMNTQEPVTVDLTAYLFTTCFSTILEGEALEICM